MKIIQIAKELKQKLSTPFPLYVVKEKPGKAKASYVAGQTVIDKLNTTFGYAGWEWTITKAWIDESVEKITTSKWENNRKINLKPEEYIKEPQLPVCHVIGKLTVHFEKEDGTIYSVTKEAPGAQPIVAGQSNQENCYKGAHTDALKKAATMFGIALELYRDDKEKYYFGEVSYENPWTEEALKEHKENLSIIKEFKKQYSLSDANMNEYINAYSSGKMPTMDYIVPETIQGFVEYINALKEQANKKGA